MFALVVAALVVAPGALAADGWLPHPADATWTYQWTDSVYTHDADDREGHRQGRPRARRSRSPGRRDGLDNPAEAPSSTTGRSSSRTRTPGLVNTDWSSNAPPPSFPVLCAHAGELRQLPREHATTTSSGARARPCSPSRCSRGRRGRARAARSNDVSSTSTYLGTEQVTVPAFRRPVIAAKVRSDDHPGRRARRPVRQRHAHDLVGVRRRAR